MALVAAHATLIGYKTFANVDESYAISLAQRLTEGFRLYEGAISQRGPLMYYVFELVARVTGWDNVAGLRLWALAFSFAQVGAVAWAGCRLFSRRTGSLAAVAMTYMLVVGLPPIDGLALHGETIQAPLFVVGATLAVFATRSRKRRGLLLATSGLAFGAAIAVKQSALMQPAPVVLYLFADASRKTVRKIPWKDLLVFVAGVIAPLAVFVLHALGIGTLRSLVYYCFTYNLSVHLRPSDALLSRASLEPLADWLKKLTAFVMVVGAVLAAHVAFVARRWRRAVSSRSIWPFFRGFGVLQYLGAHVLVGTIAASSMYRFFPHYYLPVLPLLALVVAAWIDRHVRIRNAAAVRFATALLAAVTVVAAGFSAYAYEKIDGLVTHGPTVRRVARFVEATTSPDAKLFVWGFSPWIYPYAHRRPAGRYVFETYVTGFVPWFFDAYPHEASRVVPGSLEALLGDLDREKPEIVVDAGSVLLARPMRAYGAAATWLHANYCFEVRVSGYDVYRRKTPAGCASEDFPTSHPPVDYFGLPMAVAMPLLVDEASSRPLCTADDDDPVWFPGGGPKAGLDVLLPLSRAKIEAEHRKDGVAYPGELRPPITCAPR
ncbi:hypothetical protein AKJ09_03575 [Labilithrix luteola]|uniref:Glycosyltransferase RgtA/B/C/D-like domain-containing protein n=1 Tax=Labilithrix luteola TaxID=1391654 RepID=A0A0K1PU68_9BACT|nr:glycosyltransferase family 39 protein [Labilithrix luteola]AKU96911.1 hypothetical protein AKJ09_03575 [Labilithrix luteola]